MAVRTREEWLVNVAKQCEAMFAPLLKQGTFAQSKKPKYRVTCGFPSKSALARKSRRIGECWAPEASTDETVEIFISPLLDDPARVAGVLVHEMIHAYDRNVNGHKGPFVTAMKALGLEGKPTATTEGELFLANIKPVLRSVGKYPHKAMDPKAGAKKQTTRMIKVDCPLCEDDGEPYVIRMTRKQIERGCPLCPFHETDMVPDGASLAAAG
jgi:hypothetical protein